MTYLLNYSDVVLRLAWEHLSLTLISLAVAALIGLPVGWLVARLPRLELPILGSLGVIYTIPSLALMILLLPAFGLSGTAVMVALIIYAQVILVRNTLAGIRSIDPGVIEAARGLGMNSWQLAWRVELPLALPVILAGLRLAAVITVAIATIGAKFGAGGLGTLLFEGIAQNRMDKLWIGAVGVSLLAWLLNALLARITATRQKAVLAPNRAAR